MCGREASVRYSWILFLFTSASPCFSQSWSTRTYEQALKDPKRSVVDYFLLCPEIGMHDDGRFGFWPIDGVDPAFFPIYFEKKKNLLQKGYSARELSVDSVIVDIADAYISIRGVSFSKRYTLTFVFFDRQGKGDVPAYSYIEKGGERDSSSCNFFELDNDNVWKEAYDKFLPRLWLSDLDTGPKKPANEYPDVDWEFILPQKGTTIQAIPQMTEEMVSSGFNGSAYQMVRAFSNRSIELPWDRKQGMFTKGAVW